MIAKLTWMKTAISLKKRRKSSEKVEFEDERHIELII